MTSNMSAKEVKELEKQLDKFYEAVDKRRVGRAKDLIRKYDIVELAKKIQLKYGKLPKGWQRFLEAKPERQAPKQTLKSTLGRRRRNKGNAAQPPPRKNGSSGASGVMGRLRPRGQKEKERGRNKINEVDFAFLKSSNDLMQRTGGRKKRGQKDERARREKDERRISGSPPRSILNGNGTGYSPGSLTALRGSDEMVKQKYRKYMELKERGIPEKMLTNLIITDNLNAQDFYAFVERQTRVAGSGPLDIDTVSDPARLGTSRSLYLAPPPGYSDSRRATMELIEEDLRGNRISTALFDSLMPELSPADIPPPPPFEDSLIDLDDTDMAANEPVEDRKPEPKQAPPPVPPRRQKKEVKKPQEPPPVPARYRSTAGSRSSFASMTPTTPTSRNIRVSKRIVKKLIIQDKEQSAAKPAEPEPEQLVSPAVSTDPELEKYRRMLKAGLPQGAVENCMARDGLDPSIMFGANSELLSGTESSATQTASTGVKPPTNAPSTSTVEATPSHQETPAGDIRPELQKYHRMLKAGLPKGAVENCMIRDGVDPNEVFGVGSSEPSTSSAQVVAKPPVPVASKPPVPATPKPSTPSGSNSTQQQVATTNDPALVKYQRMLKAGLPKGAVENCMIRDGLDPDLLFGTPSEEQVDYTPALQVEAEAKLPPSPEEAKAAAAAVMVRNKRPSFNNNGKQLRNNLARPSSGLGGIQKRRSTSSPGGKAAGGAPKVDSSGVKKNKPPPPSKPKAPQANMQRGKGSETRKEPSGASRETPHIQQSILGFKEKSSPVPVGMDKKLMKQPSQGILKLQAGIQASLKREPKHIQNVNTGKLSGPSSTIKEKQKLLAGVFGTVDSTPAGEPEQVMTTAAASGPSSAIKEKHKLLAGMFGGAGNAASTPAPSKPKQYKWAIPSEQEGGAGVQQSTPPNMMAMPGLAAQQPPAALAKRAVAGAALGSNQQALAGQGSMSIHIPPRGTGKPVNQLWQKIYSIEYDRHYYYNPDTKESTWELPPSDEYTPELNPERGNWVVCWSEEYSRGYFYDKVTGESRWELEDAEDERRRMAYQPAPAPSSQKTDANGREFVIVNYPFTPTGSNPHELDMVLNEVIEVLDKSGNDGWWTGKRVRDGKIGLFPYTFTAWV